MELKPIPVAALAPLSRCAWRHDDADLRKFAELVEHHAEGDNRDGCTSAYWLRSDREAESLSAEELQAMARDGTVPAQMCKQGNEAIGVNQHWLHSLEQFYAEVTVAWQAHVERTNALLDTPAGRINSGR